MAAPHTPPHLAEPRLAYASAGDESYVRAIVRGFHGDFVAEHWEQERDTFDWERMFGFQVQDRWVATCGAYARTMTVPGGRVPVAAVSVVTVTPGYRRRGLLSQMMRHQLEDVQRRGTEPVALLWASESLIYGRYGYGHAAPRVRLSGQTRSTAYLPTVDLGDGSVDEVDRDDYAGAATSLRLDVLDARPGYLDRSEAWWRVQLYDPESWRGGAGATRYALHFDRTGQVDGSASFRLRHLPEAAMGNLELQVLELEAATPQAYARLWRFLLDLDLVRTFVRRNAPADEPLRYLVADQRAVSTEVLDGTYARIVDVPAALAARRYASSVDLVVAVHDGLLPDVAGSYRVQCGPDGATVSRTQDTPDLSLAIRELGAAYLGGTSLNALHRGLVQEHSASAVDALARALSWPRLPFCPDSF